MRQCPLSQRGLHPAKAPGCRHFHGLQPKCRGAPLVCRTAAPTWAEPNALRQPEPSQRDADLIPSTSSSITLGSDGPWIRPTIKDTGTLRPAAEWYPQWMQYRRREDNYVFWQDKLMRCSLDIPWEEKRWTIFSTFWYLVMWFKYHAIPPALRYLWYLAWRGLLSKLYDMHKALVLWQCKLDAYLARQASEGAVGTFSKTMALRRLHWKNSPLAEVLYLLNVYQTGRIHLLPLKAKPIPRPTFFWLF